MSVPAVLGLETETCIYNLEEYAVRITLEICIKCFRVKRKVSDKKWNFKMQLMFLCTVDKNKSVAWIVWMWNHGLRKL